LPFGALWWAGRKRTSATGRGEAVVAALQRFEDWHASKNDQMSDCRGMVHRRAERRIAAAIMFHDRETLEANPMHQSYAVGSLRAL
jgi:hypothetical protein